MATKTISQKTKKKNPKSPFMVGVITTIVIIFMTVVGTHLHDSIVAVGILDVFPAFWKSIQDNVEIIMFIFSFGMLINMLLSINVIHDSIVLLSHRMQKNIQAYLMVMTGIVSLLSALGISFELMAILFPTFITIMSKAGIDKKTTGYVFIFGTTAGVMSSFVGPLVFGLALNTMNGTGASFNFDNMHMGESMLIRFVIFIVMTLIAVVGVRSLTKEVKFAHEVEKVKLSVHQKISFAIFATLMVFMIILVLPWPKFIDIPEYAITADPSGWEKAMSWFATPSLYGVFGEWFYMPIASIILMFTIVLLAINYKNINSTSKEAVLNQTLVTGGKNVFLLVVLIALGGTLSNILISSSLSSVLSGLIGMLGSTNWTTMLPYGIGIFFIALALSFLLPSQMVLIAAFGKMFGVVVLFSWAEQGQELYERGVALTIISMMLGSSLGQILSPWSFALREMNRQMDVSYKEYIKETKWVLIAFSTTALLTVVIVSSLINSGMVM